MKWARRAGALVMIMVGFGSIGSYVVIAGVVNAQPTTQAFDGWVAVLQKADEPFPEQITLLVTPVDLGRQARVRLCVIRSSCAGIGHSAACFLWVARRVWRIHRSSCRPRSPPIRYESYGADH